MDKPSLVKLPKEVAEAIDRTKSKHYTWKDHDLCYIVLNQLGYCQYEDDADIKLIHRWSNTNELTFAKALINGYEVEQTPEDKVREYFKNVKNNITNPNGYYGNEVRGETIIKVLNLLNIKVKGVND